MIKKTGLISMILVFCLTIFLTAGFSKRSMSPQTVYRVYLKGESIGLIKSKTALENYIDKKQNEIKEKYKVKKVYVPDDLDIVKEITYEQNISSIKSIYKKIENISPFTIKGYAITITGTDTKDSDGKTIKGKKQTIYVLDREIFEEAVDNTVRSFISEDDYNKYANEKQAPIEDVGKIIEKIYIENKITIKKQNIPVDKKIYQDKENLSKYLLFGTTDNQQKYTVQDGDTISDIAFNNKISTEEFLIANPNFTSEKSLLYTGQQVTLGILKPQFRVIEQDHVIFDEETNYQTETKYDNNKNVGYTEVQQAGVKGMKRVTQKVQKANGETIQVVPVASEVLKEPITEIIIKGGKQSSYSGGGYGNVVVTKGQWGWPASCSSLSSPFGYRWGTLHDGSDIAGCGYGSNIFAAQAGTVVESKKKPGYYSGGYGDNGEYIIIDHHNGYYTLYAHMCPGCRYVKAGDNVSKGQVIGGMGKTGAASGVHLHFGMWRGYPYRGGRALNAMSFY